MIVTFSKVHHDPHEKLTHAGFSNSQKPLVVVSNKSWLIFEKLRFMTHMWLKHMQYAYIVTQNFMAIFLPTKMFRIRLRKISIIDFSKMRGRYIFRPHIRNWNKILHQMICIGMGLSVIRPRKDGIC